MLPEHEETIKKILPKVDYRIKKWWYQNPTMYNAKDFKQCPYKDQLKKSLRPAEIRGRFIDALPKDMKDKIQFAKGSNYGNRSEQTIKIQKYILFKGVDNPQTQYGKFCYFHAENSDPEFRDFGRQVSRRSFMEVVLKMRKRGVIPPRK